MINGANKEVLEHEDYIEYIAKNIFLGKLQVLKIKEILLSIILQKHLYTIFWLSI